VRDQSLADLAPAHHHRDRSDRESGAGHGDYRADELWLGWSTDGDTFEWQPASEAFGVDPRRRISVRLAVGKDFFLAEVSDFGIRPKIPRDTDIGFNPNPADGWIPAAVPRHWFMASVG